MKNLENIHIQVKRVLCLLAASLAASCSNNNFIYSPSYGPVTDEVISQIKDSNPIIVVPGIGGTSLVDASNGHSAWGSYGYTSYWPATEKDNKLLAFPWVNSKTESEKQQYKIKPLSILENVTITLLTFSSVDLAILRSTQLL